MYSGKILILLPIWGREKITKLVLGNLKKLKETQNIEVLAVVSEVWAKTEAFKHGFKWIEVSNDDLGHKMNVGVEEAMRLDFDYLMNLGSDDIIDDRLFNVYEPYLKEGRGIFGVTKLTFIDSKEKEAKTFDYHIMIGAGRCIRKDLIKEYVIRDGKSIMYDKGIKAGLDNNSIKKFKCSHTEIDVDYDLIYDIKSDTNIWGYEFLNGEKRTFDEATKNLDTNIIDDILDL